MKTNAITRIILWSIVLVLLIGLLGVGLYRPGRRPADTVAVTEALILEETVAPAPWLDQAPTCDVEATITANGLNVRSAPTSESPIVGIVEKGDVVKINRGVQMGSDLQLWLGIYSPVEGWIQAEYVDSYEDVIFFGSDELRSWDDSAPAEFGTTATVTDTLNIRSAPNGESTVLGVLHKGESVTVTRRETINDEQWAYITEPSSGWIPAKYLTSEDPKPVIAGQGYSFDPRQVQEIDIEWAAGHIMVESANVDTIQVSEATNSDTKHIMVCNQSNDKLVIRYSESVNFDLGFGITLNEVAYKDLTVLVPMGWEFESLEIDAASALVDVKNVTIREVDFDGASGTCNFVNCVITELDLDTASGDVYFTGSLDSLDCDAASASVYAVFDNVPDRIDMDSMSGDLDITLPSSAGFTVSMDALSSDFVSDFGYSQKNGNYYRGDGKCKITLDAMSGDLYIREFKAADAVPAAPTAPEVPTAPEAPTAPDAPSVHHHTDACTTDPESCPDNAAHHPEPHHN